MRVTLLCVGRLGRPYLLVYDHYVKLLRPYFTPELVEIPETPLAQGEARVLSREGDLLTRRLAHDSYTVVLDREGKEFSSEELSAALAERKVAGINHFLFILGGALGVDEAVKRRADLTWSLSRHTFPHQLARVMVVEQLYRAMRIERGEPYHY